MNRYLGTGVAAGVASGGVLIAPFPPAVTVARFRTSAALAGASAAALGHGAPGTGLGLGTTSGASR